MATVYLDLTRDRCLELMDQLVDVARDYSDWGPDEFLMDVPDKFSLSFVAINDGIAGYTVISRKWADRVHIHHFMVHHKKRNLGLGHAMLQEAQRRADGLLLSLKVEIENKVAVRFYGKHGFTIERRERDMYWMLKSA